MVAGSPAATVLVAAAAEVEETIFPVYWPLENLLWSFNTGCGGGEGISKGVI